MPWALARSTRAASWRCWVLIYSASGPTGARRSAFMGEHCMLELHTEPKS
jgi:hypothetical protein